MLSKVTPESKIVVIQSITNYIVQDSVDTCVKSTTSLVNNFQQKFPNKKLVLSLPTPRGDMPALNNKIQLVNALTANNLSNIRNVYVFNNFGSYTKNGNPDMKFFTDKVHLTEQGTSTKILVSNIKTLIMSIMSA